MTQKSESKAKFDRYNKYSFIEKLGSRWPQHITSHKFKYQT